MLRVSEETHLYLSRLKLDKKYSSMEELIKNEFIRNQ